MPRIWYRSGTPGIGPSLGIPDPTYEEDTDQSAHGQGVLPQSQWPVAYYFIHTPVTAEGDPYLREAIQKLVSVHCLLQTKD